MWDHNAKKLSELLLPSRWLGTRFEVKVQLDEVLLRGVALPDLVRPFREGAGVETVVQMRTALL